ncbi:MAG: hypothetical protein R2747_15545 [Pyrinomonadaceae bacterium]
MTKQALKFGIALISLGLILFSSGCQNSAPDTGQPVARETPKDAPQTEKTERQKPKAPDFVDVPRLADKSAAEFDAIFGPPEKITEITDNPAIMPGEYRLYRVAGHPKGLSVRFYRDRAKRFNLLLGTPRKSSKEALLEVFKIDISGMKKVKGESLSEKWSGESSGIRFETAYAKREKSGGDFTMLHAEVGQ